jgi:DNA-binding Lrp family transcriptional regulator
MYNEVMHLKSQDIVVLIKLLEYRQKRPPYAQIAKELFLSASEVHASVQRAKRAHLLGGTELQETPNKLALEEFLIHGLKYAFPPERGELTRGVPTGYAAEPLKSRISAGTDSPPVWPFAEGNTRGYSFTPLYKTVPQAALLDPFLYEMLALIDAIRDGRSRERHIAEEELKVRLKSPEHAEL